MPLQTELGAVEFIRIGGRHHRVGLAHVRLPVSRHRLAIGAHHGPVVDPLHRFQMHDAAVSALVLEMNKPRLAGGRIHPRALVRSVDRRLALGQHDLALVRAIDLLRAESQLPAGSHPAGRRRNVVVTVALVKFRTLDGGVAGVTVKDQGTAVEQLCAVGVHAADNQHAFHGGAAAGQGIHQVCFAIVVPQGAGVDPALGILNQERRAPGTGGVPGFHQVNAVIGIGVIDVELTVAIADGRRPRAVAVLRLAEEVERRLGGVHVSDEFPVHQVLGMENGQAGRGIETGRRQVEVIAHTDDVGV